MPSDEIIETMARVVHEQRYAGHVYGADDIASSVITALEAAGYVIVPKEPTPGMLAAAYNAMFEDAYDGSQAPMIGAGYRAMLTAAGEPE